MWQLHRAAAQSGVFLGLGLGLVHTDIGFKEGKISAAGKAKRMGENGWKVLPDESR